MSCGHILHFIYHFILAYQRYPKDTTRRLAESSPKNLYFFYLCKNGKIYGKINFNIYVKYVKMANIHMTYLLVGQKLKT